MRRWLRAWGAALMLASCTLGDLDGFSTGGPARSDAGEAGTHVEAGLKDAVGPTDAGPKDATTDAEPATDAGGCAGTAGPTMVRVGTYCIDSTEVTAAQYAAFVAAGVAVSSQSAECAFNTSFKPKKDVGADQLPARFVNWCDATAYCRWAGKRLCGAVGGGPTLYENPDITTEEWFMACSQNHTRVYPYGQTVDPAACNGNPDAGLPVFVGSKTKCEGGFPGMFDMGGNVREWQNACKSVVTDGGGSESCVARGGASDDVATDLSCDHRETDSRSYNSIHLGFRCCSDAQ